MPVLRRRVSLGPSRKIPVEQAQELALGDPSRIIAGTSRATQLRAGLLREAGLPISTDVSGRFSPAQVAAGAVIKLHIPGPANPKLQAIQDAAAGIIRGPSGRPISLVPARAPRVEGGSTMGIRASLIAPGFLPTTGGSTLLGGLIQGGFDIANTLIASKLGVTGVPSPSPQPLATSQLGGLVPTGGPVGLAAVSAVVVAAGGAIVGTVIRISSRAWAAIPTLIKQAAVALGLTVAFTDIGIDFPGGGGDLSQAQQRKIARFQQLTGAGVPPGIAARATGIGRRRRRGLSWFELRGFRKISHMLGHVGMVPRGLRGARPRSGHHHHK